VVHEGSQNLEATSMCQKGDMKQGPYCGPTNIWHHRTKFSHHRDMVPGICASFGLGTRNCVRQHLLPCAWHQDRRNPREELNTSGLNLRFFLMIFRTQIPIYSTFHNLN